MLTLERTLDSRSLMQFGLDSKRIMRVIDTEESWLNGENNALYLSTTYQPLPAHRNSSCTAFEPVGNSKPT